LFVIASLTPLSKQTHRTLCLAACLLLAGSSFSIAATARQKIGKNPAAKTKVTDTKVPAAEQKTELSAEPAAFKSQLESFTRQVDVKRDSDAGWKKAKKQMTLSTSDKVRTGGRSVARLKLGDGSKVLLLQNSQAEMENLTSVEKTIKLLKGRVRAIVAKINGGNNFKIKTPVGVASVRGTDFEVSITDDGGQMEVAVNEGQVGVGRLGSLGGEVVLNRGERIQFGLEGEIGNPIKSGGLPIDSSSIRAELYDSRIKDNVVAMAAEESRNADYQVGKSLMDVTGERVRVEEYIMRPRADQFKLVVLNERANRFDYFTYKGTFNQNLPEDVSVALREVGGKLGSAPDYYLTDYETLMSNTIDNITDSASGGHLVSITFDGTNYILADELNNTRTIEAASLQSDGSYKIYNPLRDSFTLVSAANRAEAIKVGVLDPLAGTYKNLESGDIYWKTRFNTYSSFINDNAKLAYAKKSFVANTLAIDLDANFTDAPITSASEFPAGTGNLHNRLSVYYADGTRTTYDNYIIDDAGQIVPTSKLSGFTNSADYKEQLDNYNYQTVVTSTEMEGRHINLVVDPRIGTKSGLIQ
jgi:hypothetical protein